MTGLAEPHATAAPGALTADGVLVVYHRLGAPWIKDASTVREHLHSVRITAATGSGRSTLAYLDQSEAYKIAFFQDEYTRCQPCFKFLNDHRIDCVYTCLEPSEFHKVYGRYTGVPKLVSNLPGYVSTAILEAGRRLSMPLGRRTVDVGTAVAAAHRDLIASGAWSYARLMKGVDETLDTVIPRQPSPHARASVDRRLATGRTRQRWRRV